MPHQANAPTAGGSRATGADTALLQGLYKVEFETPRGKALGVIHAENGKLRGGSSAFAYIGSYTQNGQTVTGTVSSLRHTRDQNLPSVFGHDEVRISFNGTVKGGFAICEGTAAEVPSLAFKAVLTRVAD
ncbi:MAG: GrlR family regulatory protein [Afipia sp.]